MQLIIGVLFVSISATVTPASLKHLVLPTIGLVAVLVLVTRPLVAFLATIRTELTRGERAFTGWMAPRGIVAAATASTFGATLAASHVGGASKILPGHLPGHRRHRGPVRPDRGPGGPAARRHPPRPHPPAAGRRPPVGPGPGPRLPRGRPGRPHVGPVRATSATRSSQAGLELVPGEQLASAAGQGAELEGITAILLLTGEDHFNALAATTLRRQRRHPRLPGSLPSPRRGSPLHAGDNALRPHPHPPGPDRPLHRRRPHHHPARPTAGSRPATDLLFLINPEGSPDPGNNLPPPRPPAGRHPRPAWPPARRSRTSAAGRGKRAAPQAAGHREVALRDK